MFECPPELVAADDGSWNVCTACPYYDDCPDKQGVSDEMGILLANYNLLYMLVSCFYT
ncbi:unnamed protein product [marine sediment metagenome]|uniref:Uncharacterized protein n=1 Tax=marine sediment metagenome TaxID=412755 RepID=X0RWF5_9ZZZZ